MEFDTGWRPIRNAFRITEVVIGEYANAVAKMIHGG
jgi:hypothetical protein